MRIRPVFYALFLFFIIIAALAAVFTLQIFSPEKSSELSPLADGKYEASGPGGLRLVCWDLGYLRLGKNSGEESGYGSVEINEFIEIIRMQGPGVALFQEINREQAQNFARDFPEYQVYYAAGYKVSGLPSLLSKGPKSRGMLIMTSPRTTSAEACYFDQNNAWPGSAFAYHPFIQKAVFPSSEEKLDWLIINCGFNGGPDFNGKSDLLPQLAEYLNSLDESKYLIVTAGNFSVFSEKDIEKFLAGLPKNWTAASASNSPDGRDRDAPYDRLTTPVWNKTYFICSSGASIDSVLTYNLKFSLAPGNPVRAVVSVKPVY